MSFGWKRAEVVGALVNGIFLLALCFNIAIEAIQRFFKIEEIMQPKLILIVGGIGLAINIIGLGLLYDNHGHNHSHDHKHKTEKTEESENISPIHSGKNLNIRGAFIHVLGDALGSVGVMVASLIIWLTDFPQRYYVDPIISLVITLLLVKSTIPLIRQSMKILLQAVPDRIDVDKIKEDLEKIDDVLNIHEIHVWQLNDGLSVASLHIACLESCDFMNLASSVKSVLHSHGIHATTIQPEYIKEEVEKLDSGEEHCLLKCQTNCDEKSCCTQRLTKWTFKLDESPQHQPD